MKLQLIKIRDNLADSFWFLPALISLLAIAAALGSVAIDQAIGDEWLQDMDWVWSGGAEGARAVLSIISGTIMTVVSIVFSLTLTTLAQTSSHFGPRVLRSFTSDRGVQVTLGTFIATFIYSLLVLRTVRTQQSIGASSFVPYFSVNVGILLALASLAVLIYFIHHISQRIQAENLIAEVGMDFQNQLPNLFPEHFGQPQGNGKNALKQPDESEWLTAHLVVSPGTGYLQGIEEEQLMQMAKRYDLVLKLEKRPGDFVTIHSPLLRIVPSSRMSYQIDHRLRACFSVGRHRTPHQDVLYVVQQLVEIAVHALSPGINEPFTALTCIDWLGASLRSMAEREMPASLRQDEEGRLRLIACRRNFGEMVHAAFDQIRLYGASNPDVMMSLLRVIDDIAPVLRNETDRLSVRRHAQLIGEDAACIANETDRRRVLDGLQKTLAALTPNPIEEI